MSDTAQRKAAIEFVNLWKGKGDEKQETQQFWSDLLHRVYGITNFSTRVKFEKRVPLLHTSFIDVFIPETKVVIEQKSMDVDLYKRKKQSDGTELNPYEQAQRYGSKLPYSERPRWIVTCNFQKFIIYDMEEMRPEENPVEILLDELPDKYHLLSFLIDPTVKKITVEQQLSFQAGELVGKLYDMMLPLYKDPKAENTLQSLNKFCVRIVFCLYAEDAMLFGNKGSEFHDYLQGESNTRMALIRLFRILDQKEDERDPYTEQVLSDFPYVNGGLFAGDIEIPQITKEIKKLVLEDMSEQLDWSKISPTIFGAVFESTLNPETRRKGGMHYTSIRDIHKVIDPLFLDDLQTEFDNILYDTKLSKPKRQAALEAFHERLAKLHFLDPACGSGNFLTETFLSLRRMENRVIENLLKGQTVLEFANPVKVSIGQFAGIEINDFAVTVARTALWIAESQMIKETEAIVNQTIDFFPLKTDAKIVEGNALRIDWNDVVPKTKLNYIMGNPPFVANSGRGKQDESSTKAILTSEQKRDRESLFGKTGGLLDYVSCWFKKAAIYIKGTQIKTAFVATDSICQGQQIIPLWKPLFDDGIVINFAYSFFKWETEVNKGATVYVVIIGFSYIHDYSYKLFSRDKVLSVNHINAYLVNADNVFIDKRKEPIAKVPKMLSGNRPTDGGYLLLSEEEYNNLIAEEPDAKQYIKRFVMGNDYINNIPRYCLWLVKITPNELKRLPSILERVKKCKESRLNSPDKGRQRLAETPTLFREQLNPKSFIAVPKVSSGNRKYIPIGYLDESVIAGDKVFVIPDATIYHFGILTSNVHMAWMRATCGYYGPSYSYSNTIVYNNFPWPEPTEAQKTKIEITAQAILDARAKYPDSSLADLYDPLLMPPDLKKAHVANDRAVMEAYGMWGKVNSEAECVAWLFRMYEELTKAEGK